MERVKRFFLDEAGTAEATSTVVMIAGVGIFLATAILAYYQAFQGFFTTVGTEIGSAASQVSIF